MLGDGSIAAFDIYSGTVLWHGEAKRVEINVSTAEALIGMELLRGCRLEIDALEGGLVAIQKL